MDLNEAVFGRGMTWRRLLTLVGELPAGSAFQRFLADESRRSLVDVTLDGEGL